jgi:hypothetical protein
MIHYYLKKAYPIKMAMTTPIISAKIPAQTA